MHLLYFLLRLSPAGLKKALLRWYIETVFCFNFIFTFVFYLPERASTWHILLAPAQSLLAPGEQASINVEPCVSYLTHHVVHLLYISCRFYNFGHLSLIFSVRWIVSNPELERVTLSRNFLSKQIKPPYFRGFCTLNTQFALKETVKFNSKITRLSSHINSQRFCGNKSAISCKDLSANFQISTPLF